MRKWIFSFAFFLTSSLYAKPYYAEYQEKNRIVIFQGNIEESEEPKVKLLQTQYLESLNVHSQKTFYENRLRELGVTVQEVKNDPSISSEKAKTHYYPSESSPQPSSSEYPAMPPDHYMHEPIPPHPFDPPPNRYPSTVPFHDPYFY